MGDFQNLGRDILNLLFTLLPVKDALAFGAVNKTFNAISKSPHVWRKLLFRDFGLVEAANPFIVYVEQYGFALRHGNGKCSHSWDCITYATAKGRLNDVKAAIRSGMDPAADHNNAIAIAATYGRAEVVKLLLADERVDPSANDSAAFVCAAQEGHTEVVRLLLADGRVNQFARDGYGIRRAVAYSYVDIVELLRAHKKIKK